MSVHSLNNAALPVWVGIQVLDCAIYINLSAGTSKADFTKIDPNRAYLETPKFMMSVNAVSGPACGFGSGEY